MLDLGVASPPGRGGAVTISTISDQSIGIQISAMRIAAAALTWPLANVAIYVPVTIPEPVTITKMFWYNNSAGVQNVDVGIYDESGTRRVSSGSTAQSGSQVAQVVDVTDTVLERGRYYLAMSCSGTAASAFGGVVPAAGLLQSLGVVRETSALPLPATATFVVTTHAAAPIMGAQGYRTVGP